MMPREVESNSILVLSAKRDFSEEEYLTVLTEVAKRHGRDVDVFDVCATPAEQLRGSIGSRKMVIIDASTADYYIQAKIPEGVRNSFRLVYRNKFGYPYGDFRDAVNCLLKTDPDYTLSGCKFDIHGHLI